MRVCVLDMYWFGKECMYLLGRGKFVLRKEDICIQGRIF